MRHTIGVKEKITINVEGGRVIEIVRNGQIIKRRDSSEQNEFYNAFKSFLHFLFVLDYESKINRDEESSKSNEPQLTYDLLRKQLENSDMQAVRCMDEYMAHSYKIARMYLQKNCAKKS